MSSPPIDGPMMRVPLTIDELRAIAFGRSRRSSTISLTNACRAGVSNELMTPCTTCSQMICFTVMTFMNVSAPSSADEHTSELQSRGLISYAVFCLKKKKKDALPHSHALSSLRNHTCEHYVGQPA